MALPTFELRRIEFSERMSEETSCYAADLYVDGKLFAKVQNQGCGGCDMQYPIAPFTRADLDALNARIKAEMPGTPYEYGGEHHILDMDLEQVCHNLLTDHLIRKDYQRAIRTKVLFVKAGSNEVWQMPLKVRGKAYPEAQIIKAVRERHPSARILNTMPEAEALALYKGNA